MGSLPTNYCKLSNHELIKNLPLSNIQFMNYKFCLQPFSAIVAHTMTQVDLGKIIVMGSGGEDHIYLSF